MQVIADLHVHSKYSRATSKDLSPAGLHKAAKIKGIDIIATGDFTNPKYLKELKSKLVPWPGHHGLFCLKRNAKNFPVFILSTEIACIYSQNGSMRRNHILVLVPGFKQVDQLVEELAKIGNLASDGRPILGLSSRRLAEIVFSISPDNLVIPAHLWTPWFSTFGSKSGFNSFKECFGQAADKILAIETGLSSDPLMNWRVSQLDNYSFVSNGDAHSVSKVGREANVFELAAAGYQNLRKALKNSSKLDKKNLPADYIKYTIEFYPEEGKYHWDGHRACNIQFSPAKSRKHQNICPKCGKPLTLGVMHRVEDLADRSVAEAKKYAKKNRPKFKKIVPLQSIIANVFDQGEKTKKVTRAYNDLIKKGVSEFNVLLNLPKSELKKITQPEIVAGIIKARFNKIHLSPGYDGVFGKVEVFSKKEQELLAGKQRKLF